MTEKLPLEKDSPQVQRDRIFRLVSELNPGLKVEFHSSQMGPKTSEIRFRLVDTSSGRDRIIGSIPVDHKWATSEVADKSDAELLQRIVRIIRR
jgi:hypothetical protein